MRSLTLSLLTLTALGLAGCGGSGGSSDAPAAAPAPAPVLTASATLPDMATVGVEFGYTVLVRNMGTADGSVLIRRWYDGVEYTSMPLTYDVPAGMQRSSYTSWTTDTADIGAHTLRVVVYNTTGGVAGGPVILDKTLPFTVVAAAGG
jgi:hypothetical protein